MRLKVLYTWSILAYTAQHSVSHMFMLNIHVMVWSKFQGRMMYHCFSANMYIVNEKNSRHFQEDQLHYHWTAVLRLTFSEIRKRKYNT